MTRRHLIRTGSTIVLCALLIGADPPDAGKEAAGDGKRDGNENRITGVLKSVDAERGTLTIERLGVDVDEVLSEQLKARGKGDARAAAAADDDARRRRGDDEKPTVVNLSGNPGAKVKLYIKFRSSPSIANQLERSPADLQPMVGWPVTVEVVRRQGKRVVASEVIAWRGTPSKVSQ